MTWDKIKWLKVTQSDLEWPREPMEIVWMTQYDFRWVKSTTASPFWGPLDLDIQWLGDISERDHHTVWSLSTWRRNIFTNKNIPDDCIFWRRQKLLFKYKGYDN